MPHASIYVIQEREFSDRVVHLYSLYRFTTDTNSVIPVTSRAASFCIFGSVIEPCSEHQSHTTDRYSTTGTR